MENYALTRALPGFTIPEFYYIETKNSDISFIFTEFGRQVMKNEFKDVREELRHLIPSEEKPWGENGIFPPLESTEKGFLFKIPFNTQIDDEKRSVLAANLSSFLWLLGACIHRSEEERVRRDGEKTQLFLLETYYSRDSMYAGGALALSVSLEAADALLQYTRKEIPGVQQKMRKHHQGKFPKHTRSILEGAMGGVMRENGVLQYMTLGSCACMGVEGGERREGRGYYVSSHNVDTSWQQFNLVVGIATTWQLVRSALKY